MGGAAAGGNVESSGDGGTSTLASSNESIVVGAGTSDEVDVPPASLNDEVDEAGEGAVDLSFEATGRSLSDDGAGVGAGGVEMPSIDIDDDERNLDEAHSSNRPGLSQLYSVVLIF